MKQVASISKRTRSEVPEENPSDQESTKGKEQFHAYDARDDRATIEYNTESRIRFEGAWHQVSHQHAQDRRTTHAIEPEYALILAGH